MSAVDPRSWSVAQHFAIWIGVFSVFTGAVGLAINPDFSVGDDATAEVFLGIDWNGWHGLAAILVGLPGIATAWYPALAVLYLGARALTDAGAGLWAAIDDYPLGVLYLPTKGDMIGHFAIAAVAAIGALLGSGRVRRTPAAV
jgi:hypothetical protein